MWPLAVLTGDAVLTRVFKRKCMAVLPGQKISRNNEVTVLPTWPYRRGSAVIYETSYNSPGEGKQIRPLTTLNLSEAYNV